MVGAAITEDVKTQTAKPAESIRFQYISVSPPSKEPIRERVKIKIRLRTLSGLRFRGTALSS
jgi:hypothetical protein